jgi:hypothetical protein
MNRRSMFEMNRRSWLASAAAATIGIHGPSWLRSLAAATVGQPRPKRSCILLWMNGGPSQTDTFDMKPGHAHGGPFQPISTSVPGVSVCEHLPEVARDRSWPRSTGRRAATCRTT